MEGVPVEDWVGGSQGFRRPGYGISIEPGVTWSKGRYSVAISAPVALERNREKSVSELERGTHGDAAFADWFLTASFTVRF
jgi:hypothetical protein